MNPKTKENNKNKYFCIVRMKEATSLIASVTKLGYFLPIGLLYEDFGNHFFAWASLFKQLLIFSKTANNQINTELKK